MQAGKGFVKARPGVLELRRPAVVIGLRSAHRDLVVGDGFVGDGLALRSGALARVGRDELAHDLAAHALEGVERRSARPEVRLRAEVSQPAG